MNVVYFVLAVLLVPLVVEDFRSREFDDFLAFIPLIFIAFMDYRIILFMYAILFVSLLVMWKLGLLAFGDVEGVPLLALGISAFSLVAVALALVVAVDFLLHKPSVKVNARAARMMEHYIPRRINGETVKGTVEKKYELLEGAEGEVEMVYGAPLVGYVALALIAVFLVKLVFV